MTTLASRRVEVEDDVHKFTEWALEQGWGDGLPLYPPTEQLVAEYLSCTTRAPGERLGELPPSFVNCTVEKLAVNAAMAGAPPQSMPLLIATIEALANPLFDLAAINATTASVAPAMVVNGPIRHDLDIPMGGGCMGGVAGPAPAIGRAIRLVMRNIAAQVIGVSSASMFGQPARVIGIVTGEWEEESPWAPLAERRGVPGNAVTIFGTMGTFNVVDNVAHQDPDLLIDIIAKSMAYPGANGMATRQTRTEAMVAINPIWAEVIARKYPSAEEVTNQFWEQMSYPVARFPEKYRQPFYDVGRVDENGEIHLVPSADDLMIFVCGSKGNLHAQGFHGCLPSYAITQPITP